VCSPTRASLLTGLYSHEAGVGGNAGANPGSPGPYQGYLSEQSVTLAEALREAGYRTYMSGKWHLGQSREHWPRQRGFDRYFGLISGTTSYFELLQEPGRQRVMALEDSSWTPPEQGYYATDAYTDYAVERIREHRAEHPAQPFFLYLAYTAPHFPLHALPEDIARYEGRYDIGWDSLRLERFARMRELGIVDDRYTLAPRPAEVPAWEEVTDKQNWARRMAVYAAMVDRMDQGIGRVLQGLEETGMSENTLVLFFSDNGAAASDVEEDRGLNDPTVPIGARGSYVSYNEPWANASMTPFRLYKSWTHEGGIITPLIAYWPRGIRHPGRLSREAGHVIDIMATALELAGATYPQLRSGRATLPLRGRSLTGLLRGEALPPRETPLFWAMGGNWAVRQRDWKLTYDARRAQRLELFNLAEDPVELHDLSTRYPERVRELQALWQAWAERVGARERLVSAPR
jgi:arylsulfatase A-like enzyme